MRERLGWVAAALLVACNSRPSPAPLPAASARAEATPAPPLGVTLLVTGGATARDRLPLVIALHGLGDRPEAFAGLYSGFSTRARFAVLRAPDPWGDGFSWFPYQPTDGDAVRAQGIARAAEFVARSISELEKTQPTLGKPIVTGFSQGGMISFELAAHHRELVRAAIPIGGTLPEPLWPAPSPTPVGFRLIALHGEADERVPIARTRQSVEALVRAGYDARIESFPGVGHGIPSQVRARYFELLTDELATERANAE